MWNLILMLACDVAVLVLGWWVRRRFPKVPNWALLATATFLVVGVIPLAAFETWRHLVSVKLWFSLAHHPFVWLVFVVFGAAGVLVLHLQHRTHLKAIAKLRAQVATEQHQSTPSAAVDYIGACEIVDAYIQPATRDMRDPVRLAVRHDFIKRFDKVTGAKLGEAQYNRALLHQWIQSNAARFLLDHRGEML